MAYSKEARDRNVVRWWLADDEEKVRSRVMSRIKDLRAASHSRRELFYRFADFYGTSIRYAHRPEKAGYRLTRLSYNWAKSLINVLVSQLCRSQALPQVMTTGGTVDAEKAAEGLNLFLTALFDRLDVWDLDPVVTRDAVLMGTGIVYAGEEFGKPFVQRVLCTELDYDEFEWRNGQGRSLYWSVPMDRSVLCEMYPDSEAAIMVAPSAKLDDREGGEPDGMTAHDLITVRYAWHLKSSPDAEDGRFALCIDGQGGTLDMQPYDYDDFPFAFMPYTKPLAGFWGESLMADIAPGQLEIEFMLKRLQDEALLMNVSQLVVREGASVNVQKLNNETGAVLSVKEPGDVQSFQTSHNPNIIPYIDKNIGWMTQNSTVSPMAAMGQQPTGITAARALQLMDDQESERKLIPQRNRERFFIQLAKLLKRVCEDIPSFKVIAKNAKDQMMDIKLSEVNIDDNELVYSITPTNLIAKSPAARTQQAEDWLKLGALQPQNVTRFIGLPDTARDSILLNAQRDYLAKVLEDIIFKGEYREPDGLMNLNLARQMCGDYYAFAMSRNVEESRIKLLRQFAVACMSEQQIGTPQQNLATIGPHLQPVAGLPGAPPPGGPGPGPAGPLNGAPNG